jgi:hypothetical protein
MHEETKLTLEQQFNLRSFSLQVKQISHEQAQAFLVKLYETMVIRETMYRNILKHEWSIDKTFLGNTEKNS